MPDIFSAWFFNDKSFENGGTSYDAIFRCELPGELLRKINEQVFVSPHSKARFGWYNPGCTNAFQDILNLMEEEIENG